MTKKLKVAIAGLTQLSQQYLWAVYENPSFELTAVADRDAELAERVVQRYQCKFFDDFRQLIIQNQLDLVIDGCNGFSFNEHAHAALEKGACVLKINVPGPTFEDLAEITRTARKNNKRYLAAEMLSLTPGFKSLQKYLTQSQDSRDYYKFLVAIQTPINLDEPGNRWLADPELAGGGVVLQSGFALIKEIVRLLGLPEQVYALTTNIAPDKKQRMSLTEDAAMLTLKYPENLIAALQAGRIFGPETETLNIFRPKECLNTTRSSFIISDNAGQITQEITGAVDEKELINTVLEYATEIISREQENISYEIENLNLKTMALIQAAYLSAKTMMPENPEKIITLSGLDPKSLN